MCIMVRSILVVMLLIVSLSVTANENINNNNKQTVQVNMCLFDTDNKEIKCPGILHDDIVLRGITLYNMVETEQDFEFDININESLDKSTDDLIFIYKNKCKIIDDTMILCTEIELVDSFYTFDDNKMLSNIEIVFDSARNKWILDKPIEWKYKRAYTIMDDLINASKSVLIDEDAPPIKPRPTFFEAFNLFIKNK